MFRRGDSEMSVNVGIVGAGGVAQVHLRNLRVVPGVDVVAVADTDAAVAEGMARQFGFRAYADPLTMFNGEELDAVTIATPPRSHAALAIEAAARGIHIFLEKPMAPTIEECDRIIEAADAAGVVLMLGFKKRYAPAYAFLKEQEHEWGKPRIAFWRYQLGPFDREWFWAEDDGGGPVIDNTAHCLDLLRYLVGEPVTVYAEASNFFTRHRNVDLSEVVFTLRFENGETAAVAAGAAGIWADDESERLTLSYDTVNVDVYGRFDVPRRMRVMERDGVGPSIRFWEGDASGFSGEFAAFVECIRGEAAPRATGIDGKRALELGLAIKESGRRGTPVVMSWANKPRL
jgi:predicted dehydrogenase